VTVRNELDGLFERARAERRTVLIPYLTAGFPRPGEYVELAVAVFEAGADALEIGVPFSDPLLDGPAIQHSQQVALDNGTTPADCLRFSREIGSRADRPRLLMGAFNPIAAYGVERFCRQAAESGVSALIIPDLPLEEQQELRAAAEEVHIHLIQLVAPTSSAERLARVCAAASGFVYCISVAGVTGARAHVAEHARPLVERVRTCTDLPVAVGFGISGPDDARQVADFADGVIVGSELISRIAVAEKGASHSVAGEFVRSLRGALGPATSDTSRAN
jgi:tryptophan synthase alpha chain